MKLKTFAAHGSLSRTDHSAFGLKKILVPVDFSPASESSFDYALRLAREFGAELTLFHVMGAVPVNGFAGMQDLPVLPVTDFPEADAKLRKLAASARKQNVEAASCVVRAGIASHEIVEMAKESDVDLIVIATHGYTGWKHFCIGSTAERVVRAAPCPVLVVREKEHEFC
jgi:universal stress protein A